MTTGDWILMAGLATASTGYAMYTLGRIVGRRQGRACTICHDAQHPRHDQHTTWRCVDMDGCSTRAQRRRPQPPQDTGDNRYVGVAIGDQYQRYARQAAQAEVPGDQAVRVRDVQDAPAEPRYDRFLDDL